MTTHDRTTVTDFCEPQYPICKRERFDEDNMKHLLCDTDFAKADRDRLSIYNKHRFSGGRVIVSYRFGTGCEDRQLGRLYPDGGIGLQGFRFDMRNPLVGKIHLQFQPVVFQPRGCKSLPVQFSNLVLVSNRHTFEHTLQRCPDFIATMLGLVGMLERLVPSESVVEMEKLDELVVQKSEQLKIVRRK